jgi:hypothetical protein
MGVDSIHVLSCQERLHFRLSIQVLHTCLHILGHHTCTAVIERVQALDQRVRRREAATPHISQFPITRKSFHVSFQLDTPMSILLWREILLISICSPYIEPKGTSCRGRELDPAVRTGFPQYPL